MTVVMLSDQKDALGGIAGANAALLSVRRVEDQSRAGE